MIPAAAIRRRLAELTSPPEQIEIRCPGCGFVYRAWHRSSLNLDLDRFSDDYIRQATTAACPECGHLVKLATLIVRDGVWAFSGT
jgi:DNA-directed RNA polymerase subunit RPC12/RpoP